MDVQARRRGHQTYYYLTHSYREDGRVRKVEWYLGRSLPPNLPEIKAERRLELLTREMSPSLDRAATAYRANLRKMPPAVRTDQLDNFAIRFTYDTNRIEGSSLTFHETASLLLDGVAPNDRPMTDVQEALAHRRVFLEVLRERRELNRASLLDWHRRLFSETKPRLAGRIRTYSVGITGSQFKPPLPFELDLLLDEFFRWLNSAWRRLHPVVLAGLVHFRLVSIHPFGDGNGRVTRLAMNFVLHRKDYPMIDIPYRGRLGYYRALERAHLTQDEGVFLRWFLRQYLKENSWLVAQKRRRARRP